MQNREKLKFLKKLYIYKSMGYEYLDEEFKEKQDNNCFLAQNMDSLKKIVLNCNSCPLAKTRKNVVFGEGDIDSPILFVGEGPGAFEDEMGKPFVGRAGEMLTRIIENVLKLRREDVFIANIVKCRPPNNRVPHLDEVEVCKKYPFQQIEFIQPKIIVALGATAYKYLTNDFKSYISKIRGQEISFNGAILIPTFHPSFLLRKPYMKKEAYQDYLKIKRLLDEIAQK